MSTPSDHELVPPMLDEKTPTELLWHQWREKRVEELNRQQVTKDANALQLKDEKEDTASSTNVSLASIASLETKIREKDVSDNTSSEITELFNDAQSEYNKVKESLPAGTHEDLRPFRIQLSDSVAEQYRVMQRYEAEMQNLLESYPAKLATGHAVEHALNPPRPLLGR